jgi:hypothetical protein
MPHSALTRSGHWHWFCQFPAQEHYAPGGANMLERDNRQRCLAKRSIRGHQGFVSAETRGTIEAEIENLGRHMISVRWDNGLHMYVFPDEIKIDQPLSEGDAHLR